MSNSIKFDEKVSQEVFYANVFGEDLWEDSVNLDRNTDGYTNGILFEHKLNVESYGFARALSQALIYLSRFNRDGIPVPRYTCLVSHETDTCYIYDNQYYIDYINNVRDNATLVASKNNKLLTGTIEESLINTITFSYEDLNSLDQLYNYINKIDNHFVKVNIDKYNVVGWSKYYYNHCKRGKAKKIKFFEELRSPNTVLNLYINPWDGQESDFRLIMDLLNDPAEQKKIGAFYTPIAYAEKAVELVKDAISRVPKGNDYVIIDRCAGTGNLEWCLNDLTEDCGDDILSHVIVSSPELKEWEVLRERIGSKVRHLLPEVNKDTTPEVSENGYLIGSNALDSDFLENPIIKQYLDNEHCTVILFENPPYAQGSSITNQMQKIGKDACEWKTSYVVNEMKKEISGTATNDMCNAFIWSAFKYYLRQPTDSYIVFAPPKYWKYHNLVNKKMINGYGFNRQFFHASAGLISCIEWSNIDDVRNEEINLTAYDIVDENNGGAVRFKENVKIQKMHVLHSEVFYDKRKFEDDVKTIFTVDPNGYNINTLSKNVRVTASPITNKNIIGYLITKGCTLDTPGLNSNLLITTRYDEHGSYLREDDFVSRLPSFAAGRFLDNMKSWTYSAYGASGDKAEHYWIDVKNHKLDDFLCKTLIWCCTTHYNHIISQPDDNGNIYINQICFDNNRTAASKALAYFKHNGYILSDKDQDLLNKYDSLMRLVKNTEEYNADYTYGTYQIEKEIDITYKDKTGKTQHKYGDIQNALKELKEAAKSYYGAELAPTLLQYEFVK